MPEFYTWAILLINQQDEIGEKQLSFFGSRGGQNSPLMPIPLGLIPSQEFDFFVNIIFFWLYMYRQDVPIQAIIEHYFITSIVNAVCYSVSNYLKKIKRKKSLVRPTDLLPKRGSHRKRDYLSAFMPGLDCISISEVVLCAVDPRERLQIDAAKLI